MCSFVCSCTPRIDSQRKEKREKKEKKRGGIGLCLVEIQGEANRSSGIDRSAVRVPFVDLMDV